MFVGTPGGLFRSSDGADSWQQVQLGRTSNTSVQVLALSPHFETDSTIYVGMQFDGALRSTDGGESWSPDNEGLTILAVTAFALPASSETDRTAFVGTSGAGIFGRADIQPGPAVEPAQGLLSGATRTLLAAGLVAAVVAAAILLAIRRRTRRAVRRPWTEESLRP